jgi:hypothetical protein
MKISWVIVLAVVIGIVAVDLAKKFIPVSISQYL